MKHLGLNWMSVFTACLLVVTGCQEKNEKKTCFAPIKEVPFEESMGKSETEFRFIFANSEDTARYNKAKAIYEKNLPSKVARSSTPKIPKIIHQIWLGPNLPPRFFYTFQEKLKALHPDWEYKLWNEESLEKLHLDNWDLIEKSNNYGEKSDIIRADLLCRFGGVYMDDDIEPLMNLNELHEKYDFYAGMENPHKVTTTNNRVWVGISIMASKPNHPIMQNWKMRIRNGWDDVNMRYSNKIERDVNHTFFPFTHAVMQEIDRNGNVDMLFPTTYFYPFSPTYAAKRRDSIKSVREKLYDVLESLHLKQPRAYSKVYPETIVIHYWGNAWLPQKADQMQDLQRMIDSARKDLYQMQGKLRHLERQVDQLEHPISNSSSTDREKGHEEAVPAVG